MSLATTLALTATLLSQGPAEPLPDCDLDRLPDEVEAAPIRWSLSGPTDLLSGFTPQELNAADLNGDSRSDLILVQSRPDQIVVYLGGAGREFGAPATYHIDSPGQAISAVQAGDLDGDRNP